MNKKYFEDIFSGPHGEWRKKFYASYYQGIEQLDNWYGDKAYRQYEEWAVVIDHIVKYTLAPYCCDICGYMSEDWKDGPVCPHCKLSKDWDKDLSEVEKPDSTSGSYTEW